MDANNNSEMSPQKFDTIMRDTNNKRSAGVSTSTSPDTAKKIRTSDTSATKMGQVRAENMILISTPVTPSRQT